MSDTDTDDAISDLEDSPDTDAHAAAGPRDDLAWTLEVYEYQRHRNGDETALLLSSFAEGWQVLAVDVDAGGQVLETEVVGDSPDREKAVGMAEYWLDQNPDGIFGGGEDEAGFLSRWFGGDE